ncbi:MAG: hypothetical protein NTV00_10210 [Methylococcales bacterium]|nr:hypothetical protein [Methylococcales bacterium]
MQAKNSIFLKTVVLLVLFLQGATAYSASFTELKAPESRRLLYSLPKNFNGNAMLFFHGAQGNAQVLLDNAPTADIIQRMLDAGFLVVLPEARQSFKVGAYLASWESSTVTNPDTHFVDWIMDTARQALPQLKDIYLMGGSNGVSMASRIAKNHPEVAGLVAMNGLDADQLSVDANGVLMTNDTFTIPATHAPMLMISSKQDGMLSFVDQQKYLKKARLAGISVMVFINETAGHNWGEWTEQYHDDIVGWLKK